MARRAAPVLHGVNYYNGYGPWYGPITESFTGAWQQNVVVAPTTTILSFSAVYACVTGIASDIAKMRIKLTENHGGIWEEIAESHGNSNLSSVISVLKKPNHYQNRIKFIEQWLVSKLLYGNAYILKQRDRDRNVVSLYVLHPNCVKPLVAENGDVYYEVNKDELSEVKDRVIFPASEIIHDMMVSLWHPLIGVSPIYACGMSATMGNNIQTNSTKLFGNRSMPGGILTAPGEIADETAARLKSDFETNFSGDNFGRLAVLGDGLTFVPLMMKAEDAQLIEQLKWTVEDVARAFRYPLWKLGGPMPPYTKPDMAQTAYYSDCLHTHIESLELCLDEGVNLDDKHGTEMDLDTLMRMDQNALYETINKAEKWMKVDEQRFKANHKPLDEGGNTVYRQHQDYPIEKVYRRPDIEAPAATTPATPTAKPADMPMEDAEDRHSPEAINFMRGALEARMTREAVA